MSELYKRLKRLGYKTCTIKVSNDIIYMMWIGDSLSPLEQLSIRSYQYYGHKVVLYVYEDIQGVPSDVDIRDGRDIIDYNVVEDIIHGNADVIRNISYVSDIFRFKLLYLFGGWWSDADMICLRRYDIDRPFSFSVCVGSQKVHVNCSAIKSPKNDMVMLHAWKLCQSLMGEPFNMGPDITTYLVRFYDLWHFVFPKMYFHFFNVKDYENVFSDVSLPPEAYGLHLYNRRLISQYDKFTTYSPSCLFERLKAKYL